MQSQLDFYKENDLATTRQEIEDLGLYFNKREALYRQLGILPIFISNRTVLEIGPGSGVNSLYTAHLRPAELVLVEPNPAAVEDIKRLFAGFPDLQKTIKIEQCSYSQFSSDCRFDIVICEGVLFGIPDISKALRDIARLVKPGGVLVVTCYNNISHFPEKIRRLMAQIIIDRDDPLEKSVERLLPLFTKHLEGLDDMTRFYGDWIVDNLLNPTVLGETLSIPDAIAFLDQQFEVYGQSPHFISDWRWYKSIPCAHDYNERAIKQYWQNAHNFIDHSMLFPVRTELENKRLETLCRSLNKSFLDYEISRSSSNLSKAISGVEAAIREVNTFSPELAEIYQELISVIKWRPEQLAAVGFDLHFSRHWGRCSQYLSLVRNKDD